MPKLYRRFISAFALAALLPGFGSAGVFEELATGSRGAALPPAPAPVAAAAEYRSGASGYLDLNELDLRAVPAAPADGSAQDKQDLKVLFDWQARRTGAQCARAKTEMSHSYEVFFGELSPFDSPTPARAAAFFKSAGEDSIEAHKYLKDVYKRDRPFLRDPRLKPCIPPVKGFAYPSGHSAMARLFALILSDLVPARRAEFLARAEEVALNRVLAGVHHPTDVEAGKILADTLYQSLKKDQAFVSDLKALRPLLR
ncbi:MAG: phosphatase PAP2 family protein [Elusimicrobia bacterium]|nr:phosphatase PAP2 family protein [Elusimicrobiota bacterium]